MNATEQLIERVKGLDETKALEVLRMLDNVAPSPIEAPSAKTGGVWAAMGWCLKYNHPYKTTAEWMKILREGEED